MVFLPFRTSCILTACLQHRISLRDPSWREAHSYFSVSLPRSSTELDFKPVLPAFSTPTPVFSRSEETFLFLLFFLDRGVSLCSPGWPGAHPVIQASLKLFAFLPPPPKCWNYRCEPPYLAEFFSLFCFSRHGFSVYPKLSWNSACKPGWPHSEIHWPLPLECWVKSMHQH